MVNDAFEWSVPPELGVPPDPLKCRVDFHNQAIVMTLFEEETIHTRVVSALDVAHALTSDLSFGSGLLPANTLWWENARQRPVFALYVEPKVRRLALQLIPQEPPRRFTIPLPGFIFLCSPGTPPWVFAVKKRPTKETDIVYSAPLCNIFENGRSCPGNHEYPARVSDIVESFFMSFFSLAGDRRNRSNHFSDDIASLWEYLDKKKVFPKDDLVRHGTVKDLMEMEKS